MKFLRSHECCQRVPRAPTSTPGRCWAAWFTRPGERTKNELEAMALIEIDGLPVYLWKMLIFYSELLNYQRVMWLDNNKPPIWEWLKSHLFTFFQWGFQLESWCEIRLSFPYLFNLVSHVTFECKGRHIRTNQRLSGLYCNIFCCTCSSKATFVMST
jgi:hypothetical protein